MLSWLVNARLRLSTAEVRSKNVDNSAKAEYTIVAGRDMLYPCITEFVFQRRIPALAAGTAGGRFFSEFCNRKNQKNPKGAKIR